MPPVRKRSAFQGDGDTAASPDVFAFMRNKQQPQAGRNGILANVYWLAASLPSSVPLGKFHSSLSQTSSGNPMLPPDVELWVRPRWRRNRQREVVADEMVMQTSPGRTHSLPGLLCEWKKGNTKTLKPSVFKMVLMQLSLFPQGFILPFQFPPFATLHHSGMLNLGRK